MKEIKTTIFILFLLYIVLMVSTFYNGRRRENFLNFFGDSNDKEKNMDDIYKIVIISPDDQSSNQLEKYEIYYNKKIIYETNGKWNLDKIEFKLLSPQTNKSINIKYNSRKNNYFFNLNGQNIEIFYRNRKNPIKIILNNDNDIIYGKKEKNKMTFALLDMPIANIEDNRLKIENGGKKYLEVFIISFIIINQIKKELNISHD